MAGNLQAAPCNQRSSQATSCGTCSAGTRSLTAAPRAGKQSSVGGDAQAAVQRAGWYMSGFTVFLGRRGRADSKCGGRRPQWAFPLSPVSDMGTCGIAIEHGAAARQHDRYQRLQTELYCESSTCAVPSAALVSRARRAGSIGQWPPAATCADYVSSRCCALFAEACVSFGPANNPSGEGRSSPLFCTKSAGRAVRSSHASARPLPCVWHSNCTPFGWGFSDHHYPVLRGAWPHACSHRIQMQYASVCRFLVRCGLLVT